MQKKNWLLGVVAVLVAGCGGAKLGAEDFTLQSNSFASGAAIPAKYSYDNGNTSPHLSWSNPPAGTQSFVLIMDDPDAQPVNGGETWVHWNVYKIGSDVSEIAEGASNGAMPAGSVEGLNDFGTMRYDGPAPPSGTHTYRFALYALNTADPGVDHTKEVLTRAEFEQAHSQKIIDKAELTGTYTAPAAP